jgi:3-hydroxypropanoate dehydrogenase
MDTHAALPPRALEQLFLTARTYNGFLAKPVDDTTLHAIVDLMKWGPTSLNCCPGRFVFIKSEAAKARLAPALSAGNLEKTLKAPCVVIVAFDLEFYEKLPKLFPQMDGRSIFAGNPELSQVAAFRNGTLQGAYFIIAARALGLDCGPMSGFDNVKIDAEFFAGTPWRSNFLINLGYGDPAAVRPRNPRLDFAECARIE